MEVAGPLGTPLGLAQRKRASPRGEAGTSGFLSNSDSDCTVPAVFGQESHASSCLRNGILVASRVVPGVSGPSSSCVWNPRAPAEVEGNEGFPPPPEKDLKSPSSTRLQINSVCVCVCVCVCVFYTYFRLTWLLGVLGGWCLGSQEAIPRLHSAPSCVSTGQCGEWEYLKLNMMKSS